MLSRGRLSAAERSMIATSTVPEVDARPDPVKSLNKREAEIWRAVVKSMPPNWFPLHTHTLLEMYCKQVSDQEYLDELMAAAKKAKNEQEWKSCYQLRLESAKVITSLATKMRLAQQSSYDYKRADTAKSHAARAADKNAEPLVTW
jgi:hypothetical protein